MNKTHFDVKVKAWKPKRVVTIARFSSYKLAVECFRGLLALGFVPVIEHKLQKGKSHG